MANKTLPKRVPKTPAKSIQFDLFGQFVTNDQSEVSNTVEVWESIPKYFFTAKQVEKLRTIDGLAKPYKWEYSYHGKLYAVKIQPALIEQNDGSYKAFFPGITEELIEEALKKLLADQQCGIHDVENVETWIRFSLKMISKELKLRGRSRSINEIKHAIQVMNKCNLSLLHENKEIWSGAILQDLLTVDRKEYIADPDSQHIAKLPLFISRSINRLEYRQFNYDRLMCCNEQLARWVYKRLINRFRQASLTNDYHFMYLELKESGLLQQTRDRDNRLKVISGLNELVKRGVLVRYGTEERKAGRKIVNVKYTLYPSSDFVKEQKAANKRGSEAAKKIN